MITFINSVVYYSVMDSENNSNEKGKISLPYNSDYEIVDKIVDCVGRANGELSTSDLFKQLIMLKNSFFASDIPVGMPGLML